MCRDDWYSVPKRLRGDIGRYWRAFKAARRGDDRRIALTHYRQAVEQAVAAVHEGRP